VIRRLGTALPLAVVGVLLTACATTPGISPEIQQQTWQQHRQAVAQYTDWSLTARIVINTEDEGWNGQLHWHQMPESYQIQFNAPFGQGAIQLDGGRQGVEMRVADGQIYTDVDAESLLYQRLGWRFPVKSLRYWVLGLPVPDRLLDAKWRQEAQPAMAFNALGRLASLEQAHWRIRYPGYRQVGDVVLPQKIYLENTELSVRLVIDRWDLHQGS
jgi:outer membrane lipoprotein LolB